MILEIEDTLRDIEVYLIRFAVISRFSNTLTINVKGLDDVGQLRQFHMLNQRTRYHPYQTILIHYK